METQTKSVENHSAKERKDVQLQKLHVTAVIRWARVCRSGRSVNEVTETHTGEQTSYFLGSVCNAKGTSEWTVILQVDSVPVEFKIDTGADVNVINEDTFHSLPQENILQPASLPLDSPGGELLCLGCFNVTVGYKGKDDRSKMYVVRGHKVNSPYLLK